MTKKDEQLSAFMIVPRSIEGLEEAASEILDEANRDVVLEALRSRRKWRQIKDEYRVLREEIGGKEARRALSEKHHYSEKTIELILYNK